MVNIPLFSIEEIVQRAKVIFASGLFPDIASEAQASTKIMAGNELGLAPVESCRDLQIIKGRICMSAGLIAARIKASGRYDYEVLELTDDCCRLRFYQEKKQLTPDCQFSKADAAKAGLLGNTTWAKFPRNMLFSRALTNGARWFCADVFSGAIYTPDELQDEPEQQAQETQTKRSHYDGKLSNGKDPNQYTEKQLRNLLTTASVRVKLTSRDVELIEAKLAAMGNHGATQNQSVPEGDLLSGVGVLGDASAGNEDVSASQPDVHGEAGEQLRTEEVPSERRPSDVASGVPTGGELDGKRTGPRRAEKRHGEYPAVNPGASK